MERLSVETRDNRDTINQDHDQVTVTRLVILIDSRSLTKLEPALLSILDSGPTLRIKEKDLSQGEFLASQQKPNGRSHAHNIP